MRQQRRLDLARLDPEAAHLELPVGPPVEGELAVLAPAREVAGAVHPGTQRTERAGQETFSRETRPNPVTPRQPEAGDVELARHAHGARLQPRVQDIDAVVGIGPPDMDVIAAQETDRRADRRLGRPVLVDDHEIGLDPAQGGHLRAGELLATDDRNPEPRSFEVERREQRGMGRRQLDGVEALVSRQDVAQQLVCGVPPDRWSPSCRGTAGRTPTSP